MFHTERREQRREVMHFPVKGVSSVMLLFSYNNNNPATGPRTAEALLALALALTRRLPKLPKKTSRPTSRTVVTRRTLDALSGKQEINQSND